MSRKVLHKSKVRQMADRTITTSLCGRNTLGSDGMNAAESDAEVTCKFCLRLMSIYSNLLPSDPVKAQPSVNTMPNEMITIYDRQGEGAARFWCPMTTAKVLATHEFGGCWVDPDDSRLEEIERMTRQFRQERLCVEHRRGVILASVDLGADSYHRGEIKEDGLHLHLGRAYGLKSDYEDLFLAMVGKELYSVSIYENSITVAWRDGDSIREYSVLKMPKTQHTVNTES